MSQTHTDHLNGPACSLLRHLMIMLYDALIIISLMMLGTGLLMLLYSDRLTAGKDPVYTLYLFALWFLYLDWCWRHGGMTLGMRSWKVLLVSDHGGALTLKQSLCRFGTALLSALLLGCGFIWSLFDAEGLSWHDRLSSTRLLRRRLDTSA